jgi:formate C-acetyltransferase
MLHTLYNLGPAPEPNITVLWSTRMPAPFKRYCVKVSKDTSSLQYENDDLMRPYWGDDYAIACCVSAMRLGKQMQFFGARVNFAKALLYAINGGRDEVSGDQVAPKSMPITGDFLDYDDVMAKFDTTMEWLAKTYVHAMNCIHYMPMILLRTPGDGAARSRILRTMAFGIAGLSVVADSLSAMKYGKIRVVRPTGLVTDYQNEGNVSTPQFGNNEDRVDQIASELVTRLVEDPQASDLPECDAYPERAHHHLQRGLRQGDRQHAGRPPQGRNPDLAPTRCMAATAMAGLRPASRSRSPLQGSLDGISYTVSVAPKAHLSEPSSSTRPPRRSTSISDAAAHEPEHRRQGDARRRHEADKYPQLTIRVSGYAVNFVRLTPGNKGM